jgi:hypothetical protein
MQTIVERRKKFKKNSVERPSQDPISRMRICSLRARCPEHGFAMQCAKQMTKLRVQSRRAAFRPRFTPSRNDIAPTSFVEYAFDFSLILIVEVRKANNCSDKQEKHGEFRIHFSAPPNLDFAETKYGALKTKRA